MSVVTVLVVIAVVAVVAGATLPWVEERLAASEDAIDDMLEERERSRREREGE